MPEVGGTLDLHRNARARTPPLNAGGATPRGALVHPTEAGMCREREWPRPRPVSSRLHCAAGDVT